MITPPARFTVDLDDTCLNGFACGAGPPVLFLHGFPDCAEAFVPIMTALSDRHLCIALDQRGHGTSGLARQPGSCALDRLVADVVAVCDSLAIPVIDLVGHDWGGLVAWRFAEQHPGRTRRLVTFNAPHPWCLQNALAGDREQQARSAYVDALRTPQAAQALADLDFEALWTRFCGNPRETFTADHQAALRAAWMRPGAWESMLRWYQDNPFYPACDDPGAPPAPVTAPALMIWGEADPLFAPSCLEGLGNVALDCRRISIPQGGHSVFREDLVRATDLVRAFLAQGRST